MLCVLFLQEAYPTPCHWVAQTFKCDNTTKMHTQSLREIEARTFLKLDSEKMQAAKHVPIRDTSLVALTEAICQANGYTQNANFSARIIAKKIFK